MGQMPDLNGGEGLDDQVRIERAQPLQQLEIPILFQCWVEASHHMDLRNPQGQ